MESHIFGEQTEPPQPSLQQSTRPVIQQPTENVELPTVSFEEPSPPSFETFGSLQTTGSKAKSNKELEPLDFGEFQQLRDDMASQASQYAVDISAVYN